MNWRTTFFLEFQNFLVNQTFSKFFWKTTAFLLVSVIILLNADASPISTPTHCRTEHETVHSIELQRRKVRFFKNSCIPQHLYALYGTFPSRMPHRSQTLPVFTRNRIKHPRERDFSALWKRRTRETVEKYKIRYNHNSMVT